MTYSERRYNSEMYHFGILGMQWGRRNGPPYPLDSEDHSQREKAAGWRKSLFKWNKRSENRSPSSQEKEERSTKPKKSKLHLTDKQKRYLKIGAAAALTAVAAYAGYKYMQSRGSSASISKGKEATEKLFGDLHWTEQLEVEKSVDQTLDVVDSNFRPEDIGHCTTSKLEDLKIVNRDLDLDDEIIDHMERADTKTLTVDQYKKFARNFKAGRLMNCTSCTSAGLLRARGYDVVAGKMTAGNAPQMQATWWKNATVESLCGSKYQNYGGAEYNPRFDEELLDFGDKIKSKKGSAQSISTIKSKLLAYGSKASGSFNACNGRNGGHCVEFFVDGGNVKIFDNQLGRSYDDIESWFNTTGYSPNYSCWIRTDNLEPDLNEMIRQGIIQRRK